MLKPTGEDRRPAPPIVGGDMRHYRRTAVLAFVAAGTLLFTACSGEESPPEETTEPMIEEEMPETSMPEEEPMEEEEAEEETMGDEYFTLTVGDQTIEFTTINWCQQDGEDWRVTATGDGRTRDISIGLTQSNPPASYLTVNLDNADTFTPGDPAQKWKATSVEGTVNGTMGSGTATLETEVGDPPPSTEAQWEFNCSP